MAYNPKSLQNLHPVTNKADAAALGVKGGIRSGEARAERRTMQDTVQAILSAKSSDTYGLEDTFTKKELKKLTLQDVVILKQVQKAVSDGDTNAAKFLRDTAGESPTAKAEVHSTCDDRPIIIDDVAVLDLSDRHMFVLGKMAQYLMEQKQVRAFWKWCAKDSELHPVVADPSKAIDNSIKELCASVDDAAEQSPSVMDIDTASLNELCAAYLTWVLDFLNDKGLLTECAEYVEHRADQGEQSYIMPLPLTESVMQTLQALNRLTKTKLQMDSDDDDTVEA